MYVCMYACVCPYMIVRPHWRVYMWNWEQERTENCPRTYFMASRPLLISIGHNWVAFIATNRLRGFWLSMKSDSHRYKNVRHRASLSQSMTSPTSTEIMVRVNKKFFRFAPLFSFEILFSSLRKMDARIFLFSNLISTQIIL